MENVETRKKLAYFILRVTVGINILGHGLVRLPKISFFREFMLGLFKSSVIPQPFVYLFATSLPVLEFILGLFLLLGILTKYTIIASSFMMASLVFGSCLVEKWDWVGFQMIYAMLYFILLFYYNHNYLSLDNILKRGSKNK